MATSKAKNSFNLADHDGSTAGLKLAGTLVTATAAELNIMDGVTSTAAELTKLAGVTAGTTTASKALVVGTTKQLDTLVIADGGLFLGAGAGTAIGATAAELNLIADQSAYTETLTSTTPTMSLTKRHHLIDSTLGAQAFTPAAPGAANIGVVHTLHFTVDNGDSVVTLTNIKGAQKTTDAPGAATGATFTFANVGEFLVIVGLSATLWGVLGQFGAAT